MTMAFEKKPVGLRRFFGTLLWNEWNFKKEINAFKISIKQ
jgi:hypothetical protein